jgi:hypothetical protein
MFNNQDYASFVTSKIVKLSNTKRSYSKEQVIAYCSQWEKTPAEFFNGHFRTVSNKLHAIFGESIKNKPRSVSINVYFLHEYGYKYCYQCSQIKNIEQFGFSRDRVFNLNSRCKPCAVKLSALYINNNKDKKRSYDASRKAVLLRAQPAWLSDKQKADILHFYSQAWQLGLEVDHIVPLRSKNVCGLHVPWNLQLLSRSANASKNNKFDNWSDICYS